jgi:hypothetical protein
MSTSALQGVKWRVRGSIDLRLLTDRVAMAPHDKPPHRIYMQFILLNDWQVSFLEADLTTTLPKTFTFADPQRIEALARRGEALGTPQAQMLFDYAIKMGRGGFYLNLTPGQYSELGGRGL